jgi:hypothetical protein
VRERASRPRARALLQHKLESAITKTRARAFFASPAIACVRVRAATAIDNKTAKQLLPLFYSFSFVHGIGSSSSVRTIDSRS